MESWRKGIESSGVGSVKKRGFEGLFFSFSLWWNSLQKHNSCLSAACLGGELQNRTVIGLGGDLWRSSNPPSLQEQVHLQEVVQADYLWFN